MNKIVLFISYVFESLKKIRIKAYFLKEIHKTTSSKCWSLTQFFGKKILHLLACNIYQCSTTEEYYVIPVHLVYKLRHH